MSAGRRRCVAVAALFLGAVFVLALCKVEDNDAWTHLNMGREIWRLGGLPSVETFTYTMAGQPLSTAYQSWLFGLLFYAAFLAGGLTGVVLLKAALVTTGFLLLYLDALVPRARPVLAASVLSLVVLSVRFRFVERPDILDLVLLAFTIHALHRFLHLGSKRLLWAVPVAYVVWANAHASIVLAVLPFGAVLAGGLVQPLLVRARVGEPGPSRRELRTLALVAAVSLAGTFLSPYGASQYTIAARDVLGSWQQQEIVELLPPAWAGQKSAFLLPALAAISFLLNRRRLRASDLLLVLPVVALSFFARRFLFVAAIVTGPVIARNLALGLETLAFAARPRVVRTATVLTLAWLLAFPALVLARVGSLDDREKAFGLGVRPDAFPEGALLYLDRVGHTGRVLNTFHWGGYLVWRDFPRRQPFADGRHFLTADLVEEFRSARVTPAALDRLESRYGFTAVLVDYPRFVPGFRDVMGAADLGLGHPGWALVYWDDVSLLYLKRDGPWAVAAIRDGYRRVRPANGVAELLPRLSDPGAWNQTAAELDRAEREGATTLAPLLLGQLLIERGEPAKALTVLAQIEDKPTVPLRSDRLAAMARAEAALGRTEDAVRLLRASLALKPEASVQAALADLLLRTSRTREAVRESERALEQNPGLLSLYPRLADALRRSGDEEGAQRTEARLREAGSRAEGEQSFREGVKAYVAGRLEAAHAAFLASVTTNPGNPAAWSNLGFVSYDLGRLDDAVRAQRRALDLDPGFANAHYGLAQAAARQGDAGAERRHWEAYLKLEPRGTYSRRAREALDRLDGTARRTGP